MGFKRFVKLKNEMQIRRKLYITTSFIYPAAFDINLSGVLTRRVQGLFAVSLNY